MAETQIQERVAYKVLTLDKLSPHQQAEPAVVTPETDEEIMLRLGERFDVLEDLSRAVKHGDVRGLIVYGAPGVGKSYGIEKVLSRHETLAHLGGDERFKRFEIVKGSISAIGLYGKLYEMSDSKSVIVFDDCDVWDDDDTLNLLKSALDSTRKRMIHWNKQSRFLEEKGYPNHFEYKGGCILVTNVNFDHIRGKKIKAHINALESRCHHLDLTIRTVREKMLRIKQVIEMGMLEKYNFTEEQVAEIMQYMHDNKDHMRELSLRTVLKVADLYKAMPNSWKRTANMSVLR